MANPNVMAGASRLKHAVRTLQEQWRVAEPSWNDAVRGRFEERYVAPLGPAVDAALNGMHKIAEVLSRVRSDLSDRSETS